MLTQTEIDELYAAPIFSAEDRDFFFDMDENEQRAFESRKTYPAQLYFVLLLGYFRRKPIVLSELPKQYREDLDFISVKYFKGKPVPRKNITSTERFRIYDKILDVYGLNKFDKSQQKDAFTFVSRTAATSVEPRYLFDELFMYLSTKKIALPAYSSLQTIISKAIAAENERTSIMLRTILSKSLKERLNTILTSEDSKALLTTIKKLPKDFTHREMSKEIEVFNFIEEIYPDVEKAIKQLVLSNSNIEHYALLVDFYSPTKLKRFAPEISSLYLVSYIYKRYAKMNECFTIAMLYHINKFASDAKSYGKSQAYEALSGMREKVKKAGPIMKLVVNGTVKKHDYFEVFLNKALDILPEQDIFLIGDYLVNEVIDEKKYQWEFIDQNLSKIKKSIRSLFKCLTFSDRDGDTFAIREIVKAQEQLITDGNLSDFNQQFIKKNIRPYIIDKDDSGATRIDYDRAEWWLYTKLASLINERQVNISASLTYKRFEDNLLNDERWTRKQQLRENSNLESMKADEKVFVPAKVTVLKDKLTFVSKRVMEGQNTTMVYADRDGQTTWTIKRKPNAPEVNNPFFEVMPQIHIGDVLGVTQRETNFTLALTHIHAKPNAKNKPELNLSNAIACIVGNGARYGIFQMARLCSIPYDQLRNTQMGYLSLENLRNAHDIVSDAIAALPIFKHYNIQENLLHASADAQKFESRVSTIRVRYSSKYLGRGKGLAGLSLSANHVPVNAKLMALNEHESHHMFDLLYNNNSSIQPDMVSTDNHGTNQCNFALLDLSGWQFAPRYAQVRKVLKDLFKVSKDGVLELRIAIKTKIILDGWDLIQRIILSLHSKELSQATICKQLSSSKSNSKLFKSLIEYDRLIKAIYMLDYVDSEELRDYVQRALNRGEAYHQIQRTIEAVNGNKFRAGNDDQLDIWYECARFLATAIIYFNSCLLSNLMDIYEKRGDLDMVERIKTFSPVAWININLNGIYSFSSHGEHVNLADLVKEMTQRVAA
nr:Tn3 family transposase [Cellvibrio sp. BR]